MNQKKQSNTNIPIKISVAILGPRMHYAVPRIFFKEGILEKFYTDFYYGNKKIIKALLLLIPFKNNFLKKVIAREEKEIPSHKIKSFDLFGIKNWWIQRIFRTSEVLHTYAKIGEEFCKLIIRFWEGEPNGIFSINNLALELFEFSQKRNIKTILEQTIISRRLQRKLLLREMELWEEWDPNIPELHPQKDPLAEREEKEWKLANLVICGSNFVKKDLIKIGVKKEKCKIVPYGVDLNKFKPVYKKDLRNSALRILFVGDVCIRKGIPYLLESLKLLNTKRLKVKIAGKISKFLINKKILKEYSKYAEFLGLIPRNEILKLYEWADVFILPSICEGSATVTYEALACGLPVITTENSGSLVEDKKEGFIIKTSSAEDIAEKIEYYLKNPELIYEQREYIIKNRKKVGLESYRTNLLKVIMDLFK